MEMGYKRGRGGPQPNRSPPAVRSVETCFVLIRSFFCVTDHTPRLANKSNVVCKPAQRKAERFPARISDHAKLTVVKSSQRLYLSKYTTKAGVRSYSSIHAATHVLGTASVPFVYMSCLSFDNLVKVLAFFAGPACFDEEEVAATLVLGGWSIACTALRRTVGSKS